jgi:hypothetical protein
VSRVESKDALFCGAISMPLTAQKEGREKHPSLPAIFSPSRAISG